MRKSVNDFREALATTTVDPLKFSSSVDSTGWLSHLRQILASALFIV